MSRLPPGRPVCPSDPLPLRLSPLAFSFPLILVFHGSVLPRNICHTSRLSAFFPSARVFTCQIFSFLSLPLSPSNLVSLSVRQDKLSEEVQKQHDGPEENGSPPATQTEPDTGPPPNADPDASQAEEDKDKTKPLLERLKALEVTTFLFFLSYRFVFSLSFFSALFFSTPASPSTLPATPGYPLWPACLPVVRVLARLCLKAWQLIKFSSLLRLESRVILWEPPRGPQALLRLRFVFLCAQGFELHSATSPKQQPSAATVIHDYCFFFFFFFLLKPLDTSSQISSAINALRFNWIRPHVSHTHS